MVKQNLNISNSYLHSVCTACTKGLKLREFYKGTIYRDVGKFQGRRGSQEPKQRGGWRSGREVGLAGVGWMDGEKMQTTVTE